MKKITKLFYQIFFLFLLNIGLIEGQNVWTKMADFPGVARINTVSFTIGHYAFVGLGNNGSTTYNDMYKWNQKTNVWTKIADYPGGGNLAPIAFAINGKGYVGLGADGSLNMYTNLYQYDTLANSWTPKASFPSTGRYASSVFVVGQKAHMVCGSNGGIYTNESWEYNANTNQWSKHSTNFPGGNLEVLCAFTIGNTGYVGCGWDKSVVHKAFWKYNANSDVWTPIPDFPVTVGLTEAPNGFVIGSKGYVCTGLKDQLIPSNTLPKGYAYDTLTNTWTQFTDMAANKVRHAYSSVFAIGNYGYICSGWDSTGTVVKDLYQYGPKDTSCDKWTRMANIPGVARINTVSFTIGHYAFVGLGNNGSTTYNDMYKWNQKTNVWTKIADYPGGGNLLPVAFAINGKGYVGMGIDGPQNLYTNLYQYDTLTNTWTPKTSFPGAARYSAATFVVGQKAYVVGGSFNGIYTDESWEYNSVSDQWLKHTNNFPGGNLEASCAFAIGNTGYVGCGWDKSVVHKAFWKYNVTNDTWTSIPDFPVSVGLTEVPTGFVIGSKGYICTGLKDVLIPSNTLPVGYAYDTLTNSWSQFTDMAANKVRHAYSSEFAIGNYGYICSGWDSTGTAVNDLFQYYPCGLKVGQFSANSNVVCNGDSVQFMDKSLLKAKGWKWSFAGGAPATSTLENPKISYPSPGKYDVTLIVTDSIKTDTVTYKNYITVLSPPSPVITVNGGNTFCEGIGSLTCNYSSGNQWMFNGTPIGGATTQNYYPAQTGFYTLKNTDVNGCTAISNLASITVLPKPTAGINTTNSSICNGKSANLSGTGGGNYLWSTAETTNSISVSPTANTTYTLTVTGSNSCTATATQTITVNPVPSVPTALQNGNLLASSSSTGNQWNLNGNPISGATNQFYTPTVSGFYSVTVTNGFGCSSTSNILNVTVTGINGPDLKGTYLSVYPNPSNGQIRIEFGSVINERFSLVVFNTLGEAVYFKSIQCNSNTVSVDLPGTLSNGIYSLILQGEGGNRVQKIILSK